MAMLCVCVVKLCVVKLCVSKLYVSKLCVRKLCVDKLCVSKLCVDKLYVWKGTAAKRRRQAEAGRSAQPKTRTPHKDVEKNTVFRDFPTFSRTWIVNLRRLSLFDLFDLLSFFFSSLLSSPLLFSSLPVLFSSLLFTSLLFSSLTLPISAFHLSILSEG